MHTTLISRKRAIRSITLLSYVYLPLSIVANYLNERYDFVMLYFCMFLALGVHSYCYNKTKRINDASTQLLIIIYGTFFSFFFLGEQNTFDILWVLTVPLIVLVVGTFESIRRWLTLYMGILVGMILISYIFPSIICYNSFALFSLLWAGIFISWITLHYAKVQQQLVMKIESHHHTLQERIRQATHEILELNHSIEATQIEIVERLSTLAEFRSQETGAHVRRVGLYSKHLAKLYGMDENTSRLIELAAPLHDIGKVGIEDSILHKPSKLTSEEYEKMKEHTLIGETILSGSDKALIQNAALIAGGHHEKYDGSGYPRALTGDNIPISARIVAISDVFDALISRRVYKREWDIVEIVEYFSDQSGKHFDPQLTSLFLQHFDEFLSIYELNR